MKQLAPFLHLVSQSRISILGATLMTSAVIGDLLLILGELLFFESNPYIGIVVWVGFPVLGLIGLGMIPLGAAWKARSRGASDVREGLRALKARNLGQLVKVVLTLTMLNLLIYSAVGYRSYHYMESREFCGMVCHEPMQAEFNTYQASPHSEVDCVECHIGSGVGWLIKSKLDGTRQLAAVLFDNYSRPIETPLHNLRPATDVCEVCHRPESFHGNLIKVIQDFEPDEQNSKTYTILNLRVGGGEVLPGAERGIHWHVSDERKILYQATDRRREDIVRVEQINSDGTSRVWTRPGEALPEDGGHSEELRTMDCVDCHNRPTHIYLPPETALNEALAEGRIDATIPWIRKLAEELITTEYDSQEAGRDGIARLPELYAERYPEHWPAQAEALPEVVAELQAIYTLYVYPEMNIRWNTYPSLIGHPTAATSACFRCHDGLLQDEQGKKITAECEACHFVLADKERDPLIMRILEDR